MQNILWSFMRYYFLEMGYVLDAPIVPAYEFQEFINNIAMFSDKSLIDYLPDSLQDYFGPEDLAALFDIVPDYPTGPPPSPEEISTKSSTTTTNWRSWINSLDRKETNGRVLL